MDVIQKGLKPKVFSSWEDAETEFYKTHDCMSDDSDKEEARVERWIDEMGYEVIEEEKPLKSFVGGRDNIPPDYQKKFDNDTL